MTSSAATPPGDHRLRWVLRLLKVVWVVTLRPPGRSDMTGVPVKTWAKLGARSLGERDHGIDSGRAARRKRTRHEGNEGKRRRGQRHHGRIARVHAEQLAL
jgi:hypothetical protein